MKSGTAGSLGLAFLVLIAGFVGTRYLTAPPADSPGGAPDTDSQFAPQHIDKGLLDSAIVKAAALAEEAGLEPRVEMPPLASKSESVPPDEEWQGFFRIKDDLIRAIVYQPVAVSAPRVFRSVQLNPGDRYLDVSTRAVIFGITKSFDDRYTRWCNVVGEARGREMTALHAAGKLLRVTREAFPALWDSAHEHATAEYLSAHPERVDSAGWQENDEFRNLFQGKLRGRLERETEYSQSLFSGEAMFVARKEDLPDTCFVANSGALEFLQTELCCRLLDAMCSAGCIDATYRAKLWEEFLAHVAAKHGVTGRW
ncbi:MAG: hypothetical protein IPK26_23185 [Planctomycetes bacterium]|nr:hypothetical protein [Planctomycetota bacterium]